MAWLACSRPRLLLSFLALAPVFHAQDQNAQNGPAPINTERPAFTDSGVVVPKESLQIENGFVETTTLGRQSFDFPETLLRFGVTDKTELRFTAPDYDQNYYAGTGFGSGWSDLMVGVKQQLGPFHRFDLSLIVSLSFPTGANSVSSHSYDPEVQLPWSRKLSASWTTAGMLSVYGQPRTCHETRPGRRLFSSIGN